MAVYDDPVRKRVSMAPPSPLAKPNDAGVATGTGVKTVKPKPGPLEQLKAKGFDFSPEAGIYRAETLADGRKRLVSATDHIWLEDQDIEAGQGKGWYALDADGNPKPGKVDSPIGGAAELVTLPDGNVTFKVGDKTFLTGKMGATKGRGFYSEWGKEGTWQDIAGRWGVGMNRKALSMLKDVVVAGGQLAVRTGAAAAEIQADNQKLVMDTALGRLDTGQVIDRLATGKMADAALGAMSSARQAIRPFAMSAAHADAEAMDELIKGGISEQLQAAPKEMYRMESIPRAYFDRIIREEATMGSQKNSTLAKEILSLFPATPGVRAANEEGTIPIKDLAMVVEAKRRVSDARATGDMDLKLKNALAQVKVESLEEEVADIDAEIREMPRRKEEDLAQDPSFVDLAKQLATVRKRALETKNPEHRDQMVRQAMNLAYQMNRLAISAEARPQFDHLVSSQGKAGRLKAEIAEQLPNLPENDATLNDMRQALESKEGQLGALVHDVATMLYGAKVLTPEGVLANLGKGWLGKLGMGAARTAAQGAAFAAPSLATHTMDRIAQAPLEASDAEAIGDALKGTGIRLGVDMAMFSTRLQRLGFTAKDTKAILANKAIRASFLTAVSAAAEGYQSGHIDPSMVGETFAHFLAWEGMAAGKEIKAGPKRERLMKTFSSPEAARVGLQEGRELYGARMREAVERMEADPKDRRAVADFKEAQQALLENAQDQMALAQMEHMPGFKKFTWTGEKGAPGGKAAEASTTEPLIDDEIRILNEADGAKPAPAQNAAGNGRAQNRPPMPSATETPESRRPEGGKIPAASKPSAAAVPEVIEGTEGMVRLSESQAVPPPVPKAAEADGWTESEAFQVRASKITSASHGDAVDPKLQDKFYDRDIIEIERTIDESITNGTDVIKAVDKVIENAVRNKTGVGLARQAGLDAIRRYAVGRADGRLESGLLQAGMAKDWRPSEPPPIPTSASGDRRQQAVPVAGEQRGGERRQDKAKRLRVDQMSDQEKADALNTDELTGLRTRRWWQDQQDAGKGEGFHLVGDGDNQKWVNDNLGHEAGDALLQHQAEAFRAVGLDIARIGGDEYAGFTGKMTEQEAHAAMEKAYRYLDENPIIGVDKEGREFELRGGFSYGLGRTYEEADHASIAHKEARTNAGQRAGRGEVPAGLRYREPRLPGAEDRRQVLPEPQHKEAVAPEKGKALPSITDLRFEEVEEPGVDGGRLHRAALVSEGGDVVSDGQGSTPEEARTAAVNRYYEKRKGHGGMPAKPFMDSIVEEEVEASLYSRDLQSYLGDPNIKSMDELRAAIREEARTAKAETEELPDMGDKGFFPWAKGMTGHIAELTDRLKGKVGVGLGELVKLDQKVFELDRQIEDAGAADVEALVAERNALAEEAARRRKGLDVLHQKGGMTPPDRRLYLERVQKLVENLRFMYPRMNAGKKAAIDAFMPRVDAMVRALSEPDTTPGADWGSFYRDAMRLGSGKPDADGKIRSLDLEAGILRTERTVARSEDDPGEGYTLHETQRQKEAQKLVMDPAARKMLVVHEVDRSVKNLRSMVEGLHKARREAVLGRKELRGRAVEQREAAATRRQRLKVLEAEARRDLATMEGIQGGKGILARTDQVVKAWDAHVAANPGARTWGQADLEWVAGPDGAVPMARKMDVGERSSYSEGVRGAQSGTFYDPTAWREDVQALAEGIRTKVFPDGTTMGDRMGVKKPVPRPYVAHEERSAPAMKPHQGGEFITGEGETAELRTEDANRKFDALQAEVTRSSRLPKPAWTPEEQQARDTFREQNTREVNGERKLKLPLRRLRLAWTSMNEGEDSILGRLQRAGYVFLPGSRTDTPRVMGPDGRVRELQIPGGARVIGEHRLRTVLGDILEPEVLVPEEVTKAFRRTEEAEFRNMNEVVQQSLAKDENRYNSPDDNAGEVVAKEQTKQNVVGALVKRMNQARQLQRDRAGLLEDLYNRGILGPDDFMDPSLRMRTFGGRIEDARAEMSPEMERAFADAQERVSRDPAFRLRKGSGEVAWVRDVEAIVGEAVMKRAATVPGVAEALGELIQEKGYQDASPVDRAEAMLDRAGLTWEELGMRPNAPHMGQFSGAIPPPVRKSSPGTSMAERTDIPTVTHYTKRGSDTLLVNKPSPDGVLPSAPSPRFTEPTMTPGLREKSAIQHRVERMLEAGWMQKPVSAVDAAGLPEDLRVMVGKQMLRRVLDEVGSREGVELSEADALALSKLERLARPTPGEAALGEVYRRTNAPFGETIRMMTEDGWAEVLPPDLQAALLRPGSPRHEEALRKVEQSFNIQRDHMAEEAGDGLPGEDATLATDRGPELAESSRGFASGQRGATFDLKDFEGRLVNLTPDQEGLRKLVMLTQEHLKKLSPDGRVLMGDLHDEVLKASRSLWRDVFKVDEQGLAKKVWLAVNEKENPELVKAYQKKVGGIIDAIDYVSDPAGAARELEGVRASLPMPRGKNQQAAEFIRQNRATVRDFFSNLDPRLVMDLNVQVDPASGKLEGAFNFMTNTVKLLGTWKDAYRDILQAAVLPGPKGKNRLEATADALRFAFKHRADLEQQLEAKFRGEAALKTAKVAMHETLHWLEQHVNPEIQDQLMTAFQEAREAFWARPGSAALGVLYAPGSPLEVAMRGRPQALLDYRAEREILAHLQANAEALRADGIELKLKGKRADGVQDFEVRREGRLLMQTGNDGLRVTVPEELYRYVSPSEFWAETASEILMGSARAKEGTLTERIGEYTAAAQVHAFLADAAHLVQAAGFKELQAMKPRTRELMRDLLQDAVGSSEFLRKEQGPTLRERQLMEELGVEDRSTLWDRMLAQRDAKATLDSFARPEWEHDWVEKNGRPVKRGNIRLIHKGMGISNPIRGLGKYIQALVSSDSMSKDTYRLSQLANATTLRTNAHLQSDAYNLEGNLASDPGARVKTVMDGIIHADHNGKIDRMIEAEAVARHAAVVTKGYGEGDIPGFFHLELSDRRTPGGKRGYNVQFDIRTGKVVNYLSDRAADAWHYLETDGKEGGKLLQRHELRALDHARDYLREANKQLWEELANQPGVDRRELDALLKMNPGIWVMRRYSTLKNPGAEDIHFQTFGMDMVPEAIMDIQGERNAVERVLGTVTKVQELMKGLPAKAGDAMLTDAPTMDKGLESQRVKERTFKTLKDAMAFGYLPKFRSPIDAALEGRRQMANLIQFRETMSHMEDMRLAVLASERNNLDKEKWVEYPVGGGGDTRRLLGFDYRRALLTPGEIRGLQEGTIDPPTVRLYVRADAIPMMNAMFGRGLNSKQWYRAVADINAHLNPLQLVGLFHLGTTSGFLAGSAHLSSAMSDLSQKLFTDYRKQGLDAKTAGERAILEMKAAHDAGNWFKAGKRLQGSILQHAFETHDQILASKDLTDIQKIFVMMSQTGGLNGMRNPMHERQAVFLKNAALAKKTDYETWRDYIHNPVQNTKAALYSGEALMQHFQAGMMGGVIAPCKLSYAANNFANYLVKHYDMEAPDLLQRISKDLQTPDSPLTKFALQVGDRADDIFGMSNIRKLYMDPRFKDTVVALTRAFTWHKGNNRLLLKGMDEVLSTVPGVRQGYGFVKERFGGKLIGKDDPKLGISFIAAHAATTMALNGLLFGLLGKLGVTGWAWSDETEGAETWAQKLKGLSKDIFFPVMADTSGNKFRRFDGSERRMHSGYMKEWYDLVSNPPEGIKGLLTKGRSPVYELAKAVALAGMGAEKYPNWPYGDPMDAQLMPHRLKKYLEGQVEEGKDGELMNRGEAAAIRMMVELYNAPTPMTLGTLERMQKRHSEGKEPVPAATKLAYLLGMRDVPMEHPDEE